MVSLITNRKSWVADRPVLVPMTSNDLERRRSTGQLKARKNVAVISNFFDIFESNSLAVGTHGPETCPPTWLKMKKRSEAVVRRRQKISPRRRPPFRGRETAKI